ncbi:MAG: twin-arginine translocation signal domain-containing protein [Thermoguttaceae bacterium]|nr:twin-arginine translocation signal domain-containing protein [Thermoguttaceae bacterium]
MTTRRDFLKGCAGAAGAVSALAALTAGKGFAGFGELAQPRFENESVGEPLSPWRPGTMEFHHIYTGHAESIFHIFPDGTSLLIDSGQLERIGYELKSVTLPDESRGPGEYIARYIRRVNPRGDEVDYMMISHFHEDHMGTCRIHRGKTEGRGEDYFLSGMSQTGEFIHFKKGFDRGFPEYRDPFPVENADVENYRRFVRFKMREDGLEMEPFEVGRLDQLTLLHDPAPYRDSFHIRNLCGNGIVWTGAEGVCDRAFYDWAASNGAASENPLSLGLRIDYGPFRCWTAGDFNESFTGLDGVNRNLEAMAAPACGRVDVCKSNHHSYIGSMNPEFLKVLQPQVYVTDVWDLLHIQPSTMERMTDRNLYPGNRIVCPTNFPLFKREEFEGAPWRSDAVDIGGHVVIRVFEGGKRFCVYYLTAHDESMKVKAIYGPFESSPKEESAVS